jgi:hypothetical protein
MSAASAGCFSLTLCALCKATTEHPTHAMCLSSALLQRCLCAIKCRYAANQTASLGASQAVVDVRHRLTLQPQDGCFVLYVEAAVSLFALALQVRDSGSSATVAALKCRSSRHTARKIFAAADPTAANPTAANPTKKAGQCYVKSPYGSVMCTLLSPMPLHHSVRLLGENWHPSILCL